MNKLSSMLSTFSATAVVFCFASTAFAAEVRIVPSVEGNKDKFAKYITDDSIGPGMATEDIDGDVVVKRGLTVNGRAHALELTVRGPVTAENLTIRRSADTQLLTVNRSATLQQLTVNGLADAQRITAGQLTVNGLATLQQLTVTSSRKWKHAISGLTGSAALTLLEELNPVVFKFKGDDSARTHFGFIAEDIPAVLADSDSQTYRPFEVIAVLTKALQEQQTMIQALQEQIWTLKAATDHD